MPYNIVSNVNGTKKTVLYHSIIPDINIPVESTYELLFVKNPNFKPNNPAFIDAKTGKIQTYGQLKRDINDFAYGLHYNFPFLQKGDVIALFSTNHIDFPTYVHGIIRAGFAVTTVNPSYSANEFAHQLTNSKAKLIIAHPLYKETAFEAADKAKIPREHIYFIDSSSDKIPSGYKCVNEIKVSSDDINIISKVGDLSTRPQDIVARPSYLCYSSGTTGLSKGVATSQYNIVANFLQIYEFLKYDQQLDSNLVWTGCLPFFHIYGLLFQLHLAIYVGAPIIVFERFEIELFLSSIEKYRITNAFIVPPVLLAIVNNNHLLKMHDLSSLRLFLSAAAPLGKELIDKIFKLTGLTVKQAYGMTETSPLVLHDRLKIGDPQSAGILVPNIVVRLIDPATGDDCNPGDRGEMIVKGPNVMIGYLNNEKATNDTIDKDGWLHTGDIALWKEEQFFIVDRIKELIKFKGFQVAPAELENHLLAYPGILDAAVIGIPDEEAGELPRGYVVAKSGVQLNVEDIVKFVNSRVGATKRIRGGVVIVDNIPKNASGKILRREIKRIYGIKSKL